MTQAIVTKAIALVTIMQTYEAPPHVGCFPLGLYTSLSEEIHVSGMIHLNNYLCPPSRVNTSSLLCMYFLHGTYRPRKEV
jgi:hypothetical protein